MPRHKKYRRRRRRRRTRRRRRRANQSSLVYRGPGFVPNRLLTTHVYRNIEIIATAATSITTQFTINDIFNVDPSGSAIQPMGYDQLTDLYSNWQVYACSISINIVNSDISPMAVCLFPFPNATSFVGSTYERVAEMPRATCRVLAEAGGQNRAVMKQYIRCSTLVGRTQVPDRYLGATGSGPDVTLMWNLLFANMHGLTTLTGTLDLRLKYYVKWFNIEDFTTS